MRTPQANDYYIKTVSDRFKTNGRAKSGGRTLLPEWSYCGKLPTDICTWVFDTDIKITRRLKQSQE